DPPWPYFKRGADPSHRGIYSYPPMTIEQICAVPVTSIAHTDCIMWLWTTNHHMREAFAVLDAWGFQQKTILTWLKSKMGTGDWLRGQTEHCLMAARGKPSVNLANQSTVLHGLVRAHSLVTVMRCAPAWLRKRLRDAATLRDAYAATAF